MEYEGHKFHLTDSKEHDDVPEVMTLGQVAQYLHLAEKTVVRMAQRGEIPAAKIASQWRFMRSLVRDWLAGQMEGLPAAPEAGEGGRPPAVPLHELVREDLMVLDVRPGPKEAVLRQLVAPLVQTGFARNVEELLAALLQRERMMTTAVGQGVAVPHPRRPMPGMFAEPAVVLGICPEGTDFEAIDDRKVHVFFLICATREAVHLQLMARVAWLTRQGALDALGRARTPRQAMAALRNGGARAEAWSAVRKSD